MTTASHSEAPAPETPATYFKPETIGRRVLVMAEDGSGNPQSILMPFAEMGGSDSSRFENPRDLTNPIYRGNHRTLPRIDSANVWTMLVTNPNVHLSRDAVISTYMEIPDRTDAKYALAEYLKQEPKKPLGMSPEVAEASKPKGAERGPTSYAFHIDFDKLARDRRDGKTDVQVGDVINYLANRDKSDKPIPYLERYLHEHEAAAHGESTSLELGLAWLSIKAGRSINEGYTWSVEKLEATDNEAAIKEISESTGTGPDDIARLLLKFTPNSNGVYTDDDGNALNQAQVKIRNAVIKDLRKRPELIQGFLKYELKKKMPEFHFKQVQTALDVMVREIGVPLKIAAGHMIGVLYADAPHGPIGKQSYISHPVMKDERGLEIWDEVPGFYEDEDGKKVELESIKYDRNGYPYHVDKSGTERRIRTRAVRELNPVTNKLEVVYETDDSGNPIAKTVVHDDGTTETYNKVVKKELVPFRQPRYDENRLELGQIKIRELAAEIGDRWAAGQFGIEPSQMSAFMDIVIELGRQLDHSYYYPGFVEPSDGITIDRRRLRGQKRTPYGRDSQEYNEALYAISKLWSGFSEGLKSGPVGPDGKAGSGDMDKDLAEYMKRGMGTGEWPPRMYSAGSTANRILVEMVKVLDAYARRYPAMKKLAFGDYTSKVRDLKTGGHH